MFLLGIGIHFTPEYPQLPPPLPPTPWLPDIISAVRHGPDPINLDEDMRPSEKLGSCRERRKREVVRTGRDNRVGVTVNLKTRFADRVIKMANASFLTASSSKMKKEISFLSGTIVKRNLLLCAVESFTPISSKKDSSHPHSPFYPPCLSTFDRGLMPPTRHRDLLLVNSLFRHRGRRLHRTGFCCLFGFPRYLLLPSGRYTLTFPFAFSWIQIVASRDGKWERRRTALCASCPFRTQHPTRFAELDNLGEPVSVFLGFTLTANLVKHLAIDVITMVASLHSIYVSFP